MRDIMAVTAVVYTAWASLGMWILHPPGLLAGLANILMGVLLGVIFNFLADTSAGRVRPQDVALQVAVGAMLLGLYGLFSIRGLGWPELARAVGLGALLGLVMGLLSFVTVGTATRQHPLRFAALAVFIGALLATPVMATWAYNGAVFFVTGVGTRLWAAVSLARMPLQQQAFVFGVAVGVLAIALPGVSYFGYAVY